MSYTADIKAPKIATPKNPHKTKARRLSVDSIKQLARLGFDPITEMVKTMHLINEEMYEVRFNRDGSKKERYNSESFNELIGHRIKITTELLRYKYPRVSETTNLESKELPAITIQLTNDETFKINSQEFIDEEAQISDDVDSVVEDDGVDEVFSHISTIDIIPPAIN